MRVFLHSKRSGGTKMNKVVKTIRNSISKYKITFENICFEWLENKRKNVKNSTYYTYMYNIKKYLFPI